MPLLEKVTAQQSITATGSNSLTRITQNFTVNPPPQLIYFKLELMNESPLDNPAILSEPCSYDEDSQLEPGKDYYLVVFVEPTGEAGQLPISLNLDPDDQLELYLRCNLNDYVFVEAPKWCGVAKSLENEPPVFKIRIDDNCPRIELFFSADYRLTRGIHRFKEVANLKSVISGQYFIPDRDQLEACKIRFAQQLPKEFAVLHIQSPIGGKVTLWGWHYYSNPLITEPLTPPQTSNFYDLKKAMMVFSSETPKPVLDWLNALRNHGNPYPYLIIVDHTGSDIPWEMMTDAPNSFVGAWAIVSRWAPSRYYGEWQYLCPDSDSCEGQLVGYCNTEEHRSSVQRFPSLPVLWCETPTDLQTRLDTPSSTTGLIYIGHHDFVNYDNLTIRNYAETLNITTEIYLKLQEIDPRPSAQRTIFFINASLSAKLLQHDNLLVGLPQILLGRLAKGFIGLLKEVKVNDANKIAEKLFEHIDTQVTVGSSPAEILRQLRDRAVVELAENSSSKEKLRQFLNTFMYVYYGNPMLQIRLSRPEEKEDSDEQP